MAENKRHQPRRRDDITAGRVDSLPGWAQQHIRNLRSENARLRTRLNREDPAPHDTSDRSTTP